MTGRLLHNFCASDEAAIKNTVDKYERYCSSIAYRILGNGEDVRECLNDTWMKLWESIPPTVPEILSAYVGKITRNLQSTDMIICMPENAVGTVWISHWRN